MVACAAPFILEWKSETVKINPFKQQMLSQMVIKINPIAILFRKLLDHIHFLKLN